MRWKWSATAVKRQARCAGKCARETFLMAVCCEECVWPYIQLAGSSGYAPYVAASSRAARATGQHYVRDPDAEQPTNPLRQAVRMGSERTFEQCRSVLWCVTRDAVGRLQRRRMLIFDSRLRRSISLLPGPAHIPRTTRLGGYCGSRVARAMMQRATGMRRKRKRPFARHHPVAGETMVFSASSATARFT